MHIQVLRDFKQGDPFSVASYRKPKAINKITSPLMTVIILEALEESNNGSVN